MKRIFTLPGTMLTLMRRTTSGIHLSAICLAVLLIAGMPDAGNAQQFVKTYSASASCSQTPGNLDMQMITRSGKTATTFYIAGIQDNSIYITEVDDMGLVLQEKLVGINSTSYIMNSMITDDDGNIVIVGRINLSLPHLGFLIKITPALSVLLHRTYSITNPSGNNCQMYFGDIKDNIAGGAYYISGAAQSQNTLTRNEGLLLRVSRTTGNILNMTNSNSSNYDGADGYDALVINLSTIPTLPSTIHVVGMLGGQALSTFRPWINTHNFNNLSFIAAMRYLKDRNNNNVARIYPSSLINDGLNMLNCWNGDVNGTTVAKNAGISSIRTADLLPNWQTEYTIKPMTQQKFVLTKVATDPNGYVAQGNWWDGNGYSTGFFGEMILLRTTKAGIPIWSRKINDVYVNSFHHNASFVIDGNSIFTVGLKRADANNAFSRGVFVRIPLANGQMDTLCTTIQAVTTTGYTYNAPENVNNIDLNANHFETFFPINCTKTDEVKNCDICDPLPTVPSAAFSIAANETSNPNFYQVTATPTNFGPSSYWTIVKLDNAGNEFGLTYTSTPGGPWANSSSTTFGGYPGAESATGNGQFTDCQRYRVRHITFVTNNCGITKSDTVKRSAYICTTGKAGKRKGNQSLNRMQNDDNELSNTEEIRLMPNPVTRSSFTLESFSKTKSTVTVTIVDMHGRQVAIKNFTSCSGCTNRYSMDAKQLANGAYTAIMLSEGKTTTQKFVVAK